MALTDHFNLKKTPQTQPVPGKSMAQNNAGGFSFALDKWARLNQFLILGSEGGTYYVGEKELTIQNANSLVECIKADGKRVVRTIVEVSHEGRAPKNDSAIFALAVVCALGDAEAKAEAYASITKVCRIGTHIFQFCENIQALRGWSRGLKNGVSKFYLNRNADQLAYQLIKYQQRNGWTHRDVLRLAHPTAKETVINGLLGYAVGKVTASEVDNAKLQASDALKACTKADVKAAIKLITAFDLPRECVPTELLNEVAVWEALLENMPMTAMIRNLGKMTSVGLLKSNTDKATKHIREALLNEENLKKARIHPLSLLISFRQYAQGRGMKGSLSWSPISGILDAANDAFYLSFKHVEPTGKNCLIGLDVSGSMSSQLSNLPISAREASSALCMVDIRNEPATDVIAFSDRIVPFPISKTERLDAVCNRSAGLPFQSTDCAQPMLYALKNKLHVDVFKVYTDSETYVGSIHPFQALREYRQKMGIAAKLIVVGMASNGFTIADPSDSGMLDVVGLDPSVPEVMSSFILS